MIFFSALILLCASIVALNVSTGIMQTLKKKRKKLKRTEAAKLRAILDRKLASIYGWGKNKC